MKELIEVHFDEFLLAILFLITMAVWVWKPDAKEWVGGFLAALIMALRNKMKSGKDEIK